jgi:DNA topoisomerase-3
VRLFIAEKPSLGRAIADCLPGPQRKDGDCIRCGDNDVVAWCVGHIMELSPPDAYNPSYKEWKVEHLPIIPREWKLDITNPTLYKNIKKLAKEASTIVHAGDPDREGQNLVDEVLEHLGNTKPVKRILISDLNPPAVKRALADLKDNAEFQSLNHSALARGRADWLYGLNMTRLYTLLGREGGYSGLISVGRVQTPLLGLIVRRDREIANFVSRPFYTIAAELSGVNGSFVANWKAGQSAEPYLDEEGRLVNLDYAKALIESFQEATGVIDAVDKKDRRERQPLPFSLAAIQVAAAKKYDYSAQEVLEACQGLYETHKMTTYPRSDCSYLPDEHRSEAKAVIEAVAANLPACQSLISGIDTAVCSPAWNDDKVTAHHAIIPTPTKGNIEKLTDKEKAVYTLICERYLLQFYPDHKYQETKVAVSLSGEKFTATGRVIVVPGWKAVYSQDDKPDNTTKLPAIAQGESVNCIRAAGKEKKTTPPKHFNNETIVTAMSGISRFVTNEKIRALLKESDGIGTPATQSQIIETLFNRNYVEKKKKSIVATELGCFLIDVLPEVATTPDMTAFWESAMGRILGGDMALDSFISGVQNQLSTLIGQGVDKGALSIPGFQIFDCPADSCNGKFSKRPGKDGYFWGCSNYKDGCKETRPDKGGKPDWNPKSGMSKSKKSSGRGKSPARKGLSSRRRR